MSDESEKENTVKTNSLAREIQKKNAELQADSRISTESKQLQQLQTEMARQKKELERSIAAINQASTEELNDSTETMRAIIQYHYLGQPISSAGKFVYEKKTDGKLKTAQGDRKKKGYQTEYNERFTAKNVEFEPEDNHEKYMINVIEPGKSAEFFDLDMAIGSEPDEEKKKELTSELHSIIQELISLGINYHHVDNLFTYNKEQQTAKSIIQKTPPFKNSTAPNPLPACNNEYDIEELEILMKTTKLAAADAEGKSETSRARKAWQDAFTMWKLHVKEQVDKLKRIVPPRTIARMNVKKIKEYDAKKIVNADIKGGITKKRRRNKKKTQRRRYLSKTKK
jgi:hypothetical protein